MKALSRDITVAKMQATGNTFALIDERPPRFQGYAELARRLCDQAHGVDADGLLVEWRVEGDLDPVALFEARLPGENQDSAVKVNAPSAALETTRAYLRSTPVRSGLSGTS